MWTKFRLEGGGRLEDIVISIVWRWQVGRCPFVMCLRTLGNILHLKVSSWKLSICHMLDGRCMCVDRVLCWDMRS